MSRQVSDFVVERLGAWGIKRVFGYPGDEINGVITQTFKEVMAEVIH